MTVGDKIRKARLEKNLSVSELSRMSNVHRRTISLLELNKQEPLFINICKLAKALDLSLDYLAGRD